MIMEQWEHEILDGEILLRIRECNSILENIKSTVAEFDKDRICDIERKLRVMKPLIERYEKAARTIEHNRVKLGRDPY